MGLTHLKRYVISLGFLLYAMAGSAQRYLSDYDSTFFVRDTVRPFLKRMANLHFSGYIQPQYQVAQSKGAPSFAGGNFADSSNNRFMVRRGRIKVDYILPAKHKDYPMAQFTFQFDVTERGAFANDVFLRLYAPRARKFSLTMGLFSRPYGYELNLSSAFRESPERGRMSQILMPKEKDLGAMITYETKQTDVRKPMFKWDAGVFNGPGLSGTNDFDSYKDFISRLNLKPYKLGSGISISAGFSFLYGGWMQGTRYRYESRTDNVSPYFVVDSSLSNLGAKAPRHYYGGDIQLAFDHGWGKTELRGEYWRGKQPGTASTTVSPGTLIMTPTYIRNFDGAFFYLIQNMINREWELVLKYDWYDPNRLASRADIGKAGSNLTVADIKYTTLGFGLTHYFNDNVKVLAYYDLIKNEKTALAGYGTDCLDNVLTLRMQLRF